MNTPSGERHATESETTDLHAELLQLLKALADANRLRIVGLLAQRSLSVEELAANLGVGMPTTSHHLSRLAASGLVEARPSGHHSLYSLRPHAIQELAQRLLRQEALPRLAPPVTQDAFDRKVLRTFTDEGGRITSFPAQQKKYLVLVRHVLRAFEKGRRYSEREVNAVLRNFNDDTARLRRSLVEHGFMQREGGGGAYWRVDTPSPTGAASSEE